MATPSLTLALMFCANAGPGGVPQDPWPAMHDEEPGDNMRPRTEEFPFPDTLKYLQDRLNFLEERGTIANQTILVLEQRLQMVDQKLTDNQNWHHRASIHIDHLTAEIRHLKALNTPSLDP